MGLREGMKTQTSHNVHERFGKIQQGGTYLIANENVALYVKTHGSDKEGLGRWSWMHIAGNTSPPFIITAYTPCATRNRAISTTITQQKRYWRLQGDLQCPRKILRRDLITQMKQWREDSNTLILLLDRNAHMKGGQLSRILKHPDLDIKYAIDLQTGIDGPATFVRGTRQIDGAWITLDIDGEAARFLPFFFGVGDHRGLIFDIPKHSLLGGDIHRISRPTACRLQCNRHEVS